MRKLLNNQRGSMDLILILVLIVVAAGVGGYVYNLQRQAQKADTAAGTGVTVAKHVTSHTSAEAVTKVNQFYAAYIAASIKDSNTPTSDQTPTTVNTQATIKQYLPASLVQTLNDRAKTADTDGVTCGQTIPGSATATVASSTATSAILTINETDPAATTDHPQVTVTLSNLAITNITCPN